MLFGKKKTIPSWKKIINNSDLKSLKKTNLKSKKKCVKINYSPGFSQTTGQTNVVLYEYANIGIRRPDLAKNLAIKYQFSKYFDFIIFLIFWKNKIVDPL